MLCTFPQMQPASREGIGEVCATYCSSPGFSLVSCLPQKWRPCHSISPDSSSSGHWQLGVWLGIPPPSHSPTCSHLPPPLLLAVSSSPCWTSPDPLEVPLPLVKGRKLDRVQQTDVEDLRPEGAQERQGAGAEGGFLWKWARVDFGLICFRCS